MRGLRSLAFRDLLYASSSQKLYAATAKGIYAYDFRRSVWEELYRGLENNEAVAVSLSRGADPFLFVLTPAGLFRLPIPGALEIDLPSPRDLGPEKAGLFRKLISLEPTAREIHRAVIRANDLGQGKIKRWQAASRLRSVLPTFSFGRDLSRSTSIDLDRGGTNDPDRYILGPEDISHGWDMKVGWDLGDFIWNTAQTSIDSRSKMNAEYRNDILAEATRLYYERRRLQMQMVFSPAEGEEERFDELLRMDELTALLDGMTGGMMGKKLAAIYEKYPELNGLWEITPRR